MKTNRSFALIVLLSVAPMTQHWAQAAALDTSFTYQGRLTAGGAPANGLVDLRLTLFDSAGNPAGPVLTRDGVAVSNGLFMTGLDFGAALFNGSAYTLEVAVRPGGSTAAYSPLLPRQLLTATPYALYAANAGTTDAARTASWSGLTGLPQGFADGVDNDTTYSPGLGLALNGTQFNVKFLGSGMADSAARSDHTHSALDIVTGTLREVFIDSAITRDDEVLPIIWQNGGKGSRIDADALDGLDSSEFWKLGGNSGTFPGTHFLGTTDNRALELKVNSARALRLEPNVNGPNLIGGAAVNFIIAGVAGATIAGGGTPDDGSGVAHPNQVGSAFGTIGGGLGNAVSGYASIISGGRNNSVQPGSDYTAIGGGRFNVIQTNADSSAIGGGTNNNIRAGAIAATIAGGRQNIVQPSAIHGTIPGGAGASSANYGQFAYAGGAFGINGDAQTSVFVLRGTTASSTQTEIFLDGATQRMRIPTDGRWAFDIMVIAAGGPGGTNTAAFQIRGAIQNVGGVTALVGNPILNSLGATAGATSWTALAAADNVNDALVIRVGGSSLAAVRWVATVRTVELIL